LTLNVTIASVSPGTECSSAWARLTASAPHGPSTVVTNSYDTVLKSVLTDGIKKSGF